MAEARTPSVPAEELNEIEQQTGIIDEESQVKDQAQINNSKQIYKNKLP